MRTAAGAPGASAPVAVQYRDGSGARTHDTAPAE
jgi:hypothetical protein